MSSGFDLRAVVKTALSFRRARHWEQFHTPTNLAKGLAVEASELLELFLWVRNRDEEEALLREKRTQLEEELADVAIFLMYLSHDLGIDLAGAVRRKIKKNAAKYPVAKARGTSKKYDEL
jgi:NTP pyrophosphatase (non-canonical NTP hydrolase)